MALQADDRLTPDWDAIAQALRDAGMVSEAVTVPRFPRTALDDPLVRGLFVAATSIRDVDRAEKLARQLIAFAPENPFAYLALSLVHLRAGRLPDAVKAFDRAVRQASSLPRYLSLRVHWLCLRGEQQQARRVLRDLLRTAPDRWETQRAFAHWLLAAQRPRERALQRLLSLAASHPDDPITIALLTQALLHCGDREGADQRLRRIARCLPPLTFSDFDAFVAHILVKQTLARRFWWLRPLWGWERLWLMSPPQRYFVAIAALWGTVAIVLAGLHTVCPPFVAHLLTAAAVLWCLYTRCADVMLLSWWRHKSRKRGGERRVRDGP